MKIMVLLSRFPYPLEKGDKLRAYHQIKALSKKHKVVLVCLSDRKIPIKHINHIQTLCYKVFVIRLNPIFIVWQLIKGIFSEKPFQCLYFYQKHAQQKINSIIETELPAHLFVQLIRTAEYAKPFSFIPSTLDYMDAFSSGMEKRKKGGFAMFRKIVEWEAERLKQYESDIFKYFSNKCIISKQDRELIQHPEKEEIEIIPNGVDLYFFSRKINVSKKYDIVFTGNMNYPPNIKAAQFLAKKIMPLLWQKIPNASLLIAGATPARTVRVLANKNVYVSGWMEDIRDAYQLSNLFVAPMQIGTGLQNKLLEAMSMQMPCITSQLANNALGAKKNEEVLIGDDAQSFTNHIFELLNDEKRASTLALNARKFVENSYSWDKNGEKLINLIEK